MQIETNCLTGGWIQTFTGKKFYPLAPRIEHICIEDIAHALSMICRYGGHCREFYSVAQHSVMVSDWLPELKLEGLMHDASEAYLGDVTRPVKHSDAMKEYRQAEHHLEAMINAAFDLDATPETAAKVKEYDNRALFTERKFILTVQEINWSQSFEPFPVAYIVPMQPSQAEAMFLSRFYALIRERESHAVN